MELKRQSVTVPSSEAGVAIAAQKISPESLAPSTRRPAVILAHGVACTMEYGIAGYAEVRLPSRKKGR